MEDHSKSVWFYTLLTRLLWPSTDSQFEVTKDWKTLRFDWIAIEELRTVKWELAQNNLWATCLHWIRRWYSLQIIRVKCRGHFIREVRNSAMQSMAWLWCTVLAWWSDLWLRLTSAAHWLRTQIFGMDNRQTLQTGMDFKCYWRGFWGRWDWSWIITPGICVWW